MKYECAFNNDGKIIACEIEISYIPIKNVAECVSKIQFRYFSFLIFLKFGFDFIFHTLLGYRTNNAPY